MFIITFKRENSDRLETARITDGKTKVHQVINEYAEQHKGERIEANFNGCRTFIKR